MRFYSQQHKFYCGIDLHTRVMYVCITDGAGKILVHKNLRANPDSFARVIEPYREDLVVAVECVFVWYWLADVCAQLGVKFVLGHALYMKAIHGGKVKNDRIDSQKIAQLLRSGMLPEAYAYPESMRSTRDLLRRRMYLVRRQAELQGHIQNTRHQYNLPAYEKRLDRAANREGIADHFDDAMVAASIQIDSNLLDSLHQQILLIEQLIGERAHEQDPVAVKLLRTIPGIGKILALTVLYEIGDITRFSQVGNFISYSRLVKCAHESAGKKVVGRNNKIGNAHLKWAFSEAACLFLRESDQAKAWHQKLISKYGKGKALSIIAQRLGRTAYTMLKRRTVFDREAFFASLN
jgi:transposase